MKKTKKIHNSYIPLDWEILSLNECFDILDNKRKPLNSSERIHMKGTIPYYGANGVVDYINDYIFNDELVLIAEDGGSFDQYQTKPIAYMIEGKSWVNNHAHVLKAKQNFNQKYLFYCLEHKNILIWLNGGTRAKLNKSSLEKLPLQIAPFFEQKAIAKSLNLMDEIIKRDIQLINQKELYRKGLQQNLLNGINRVQKCIKSKKSHKTKLGILPIDWQISPIKEVLVSVGELLTPKKENLYQQIGIRSHKKGIFYKEKVTGASLGNKRVFWIEPDCFIVNIVFAWEHAIAKTTKNEVGMIASHRFPMYKPKDSILDLDYLLYFFKSPRGKHLLGLASPGGAGRNKTLGKLEFMKLRIPVPPIEEQKAIAKILLAVDKEIELLKTKTEKLKEQKKGMMQVLLTGKKRLKYE